MAEKVRALTKKQLETLRQKLLSERESLMFGEKNLDGISLSLPDSGDEVEQSITDYNNSHLLRFRNREVFYAKKIDGSLKKFEVNEYGMCNECASWIKFERLMARPTAELCIQCKEEAEREESSSFTGRQSKSYGKTVDLTGMLA
jgi:DnaK suppressor protein